MKTIRSIGKISLWISIALTVLWLITAPMLHDAKAGESTVPYARVSVDPARYLVVKADDTFTVKVNIANVSDLQGFDLRLAYDKTLVKGTEVCEGAFLKRFGSTRLVKAEVNYTAGFTWVAVALVGATPTYGAGTLLEAKCPMLKIRRGHRKRRPNSGQVGRRAASLAHARIDSSLSG